jgi:hypothetical protein
MFIKNYTSEVAVSKTVALIEELLARFGAKAIGKNYQEGRLDSLTFQLEINGADVLIRLPANPTAVYDTMRKERQKLHKGTLRRLQEQADRTAWKIQQDWLEIELTKIQLNQTEKLQAFLAYIWDGKQTYYSALKESRFKGLLPEKTTP